MKKEKKYEIILNIIMIIGGIILSIIGRLIYPMVALVLPIGIFSFLYGSYSMYKSVK